MGKECLIQYRLCGHRWVYVNGVWPDEVYLHDLPYILYIHDIYLELGVLVLELVDQVLKLVHLQHLHTARESKPQHS
jgi:hypothetical protein